MRRSYQSEEFERVERPTLFIVVDGEEEFEVEAVLRHKGSGARLIRVPRVLGLRAINRVKTRLGVRYPRDYCTGRRPTGMLPSVAAAPLTLTYWDYLPCRLGG